MVTSSGVLPPLIVHHLNSAILLKIQDGHRYMVSVLGTYKNNVGISSALLETRYSDDKLQPVIGNEETFLQYFLVILENIEEMFP